MYFCNANSVLVINLSTDRRVRSAGNQASDADGAIIMSPRCLRSRANIEVDKRDADGVLFSLGSQIAYTMNVLHDSQLGEKQRKKWSG